MNVISLFDGMSCAMIALNRLGIKPDNYFASEIDKYAIQVSKSNWPEIIHIGDVSKVHYFEGILYTEFGSYEVSFANGLICGGSPCQGFSFAGKQLNFEDPRSKLFFEFVRIYEEIKAEHPQVKVFLENVVMKKEYQVVISEKLGLQPVLINSALVSAQNRKRLYWTNIPFQGQPADRGILLKDILETEGNGVIKNHGEYEEREDKGMCLDANYFKGVDNPGQRTLIKSCIEVGNIYPKNGMAGRIYSDEGKSPSLRTTSGGNSMPKILLDQITSDTNRKFDISFHENGNIRPHKLDVRKSGISEIGTIVHPDNKCVTHIASHTPNVLQNNFSYRKLTVIECERLQCVDDNYTNHVSNSQRYRMLGNGWNVDTIVHLFEPLLWDDIL